jgi:hypothetical protein
MDRFLTTIKVSFRVIGKSLNPEMITTCIGVEPTSVIYHPIAKTTEWKFTQDPLFDIEAITAMQPVMDMLLPHANELTEIRDTENLRMEMQLVIFLGGTETPILTLEEDTIRDLALLGCSYDVDLYLA